MIYKSLISGILTKYVVTLSKLDPLDTTQKFITRLLHDGFEFQTVYDIGAFKGDWTRQLKSVLPRSDFYLFEANLEHKVDLDKSGSRYFLEVLSSSGETREWWSIAGTGDSLFRENHTFYKEAGPVFRNTKTLNSLILDANLPLPDLIKIDVQGAELEVLKGGSAAVVNAAIIILELPIVEYNLGAPNISEYLTYMKEIGFLPLDILEIHHSDGLLVQIDIGFAKRDLIRKHYDTDGAFFY